MMDRNILDELWSIIDERFCHPTGDSYIHRLISGEKGTDRVLEKVGEEAVEFIIAAKNGDSVRVTEEAADLFFHMLIALRASGCTLDDLLGELSRRRR